MGIVMKPISANAMGKKTILEVSPNNDHLKIIT